MAQGSIKKFIAKDGSVSYRARADGGIDPATGKRRQPMETFKTRKDAQAWLREQQHRADRGEWVDARKATLGEWIAEWLAGAGARGRRESTQRLYDSLLRGRVAPAVGHLRLTKLTPAAMEGFFRQQEQEIKLSSARTLYAALHVCLADAERLGLILANPLRRVRAPSVPATVRASWTPEQARRLLDATPAGDERTFWLLVLACGLRIGEVLALQWDDCDLDQRRVHVRRTMTRNSTGSVIGDTTKSGKSRTLPLSAPVAALLREQRRRVDALRAAHADVWDDHDLVFPNAIGAPRSDSAARWRLRALCAAAGVPPLTPHGLRHTAASILAEHAPVSVARDVLGHSNLAITNTYVHTSDAARRAGADKLTHLLTDSQAGV
jgi:integrase